MKTFEDKVQSYINQNRLFEKSDKIIIGLSGGADSVALVRVLLNLGYQIEAAHCNFNLRGLESLRDEMFCVDLCSSLHINIHIKKFDTLLFSKEKRISVEMAARTQRYEWFEEIRKETRANVIAIAHHQEDNIETFFLNLLRGTGIKGLTGISNVNGTIVRPLLNVSKLEILEYLKNLSQTFVIDSSNFKDEFTRNKIRHQLLPVLDNINQSAKNSILATINNLTQAYLVYNYYIKEGKKRVLINNNISIQKLLEEPSPESLLYEIISQLGFNQHQNLDILNSLSKQSGKSFYSDNYRIVKDRELLLISPIKKSSKPQLIKREEIYTQDFVISKDKKTACFDADKLHGNISLRRLEKGDWFIPFGMKGRKKISDYMTDKKFSILDKENQWVLCVGNDIAWLVGERIDNRFRIDEHTKRLLIYQIK